MGEFSSELELTEQHLTLLKEARDELIQSNYQKNVSLKYKELEKAYYYIRGSLAPNVQLNTLMEHIEHIAEKNSGYLWYNKDNSDGTFDRAFYAHSEIIIFCQYLCLLHDRYFKAIQSQPDSILPCLNKILSVMQKLYTFEHYLPETIVATSGDYEHYIEHYINVIYATIRPAMLPYNALLLKNNKGKNESETTELKPSLVPSLISEIEQFILNTLSIRQKISLQHKAQRQALLSIHPSHNNNTKPVVLDAAQSSVTSSSFFNAAENTNRANDQQVKRRKTSPDSLQGVERENSSSSAPSNS